MVCNYGIYLRPTLGQIDAKTMQLWQHFGHHFSN